MSGENRQTIHLEGIEPCPWLPRADAPLDSHATRRFGKERGPAFYEAALCYAQSLWLQGFPARALLLVNRALGANVSGKEPVVAEWPLPYRAAAWIMQHRGSDQFIGNPRRHYQHLATRMVEPRKELRTWRAWACWAISRRIFPDYPADEEQIENEGVVEPTHDSIAAALKRHGLPGEGDLWHGALEESEATHFGEPRYG